MWSVVYLAVELVYANSVKCMDLIMLNFSHLRLSDMGVAEATLLLLSLL